MPRKYRHPVAIPSQSQPHLQKHKYKKTPRLLQSSQPAQTPRFRERSQTPRTPQPSLAPRSQSEPKKSGPTSVPLSKQQINAPKSSYKHAWSVPANPHKRIFKCSDEPLDWRGLKYHACEPDNRCYWSLPPAWYEKINGYYTGRVVTRMRLLKSLKAWIKLPSSCRLHCNSRLFTRGVHFPDIILKSFPTQSGAFVKVLRCLMDKKYPGLCEPFSCPVCLATNRHGIIDTCSSDRRTTAVINDEEDDRVKIGRISSHLKAHLKIWPDKKVNMNRNSEGMRQKYPQLFKKDNAESTYELKIDYETQELMPTDELRIKPKRYVPTEFTSNTESVREEKSIVLDSGAQTAARRRFRFDEIYDSDDEGLQAAEYEVTVNNNNLTPVSSVSASNNHHVVEPACDPYLDYVHIIKRVERLYESHSAVNHEDHGMTSAKDADVSMELNGHDDDNDALPPTVAYIIPEDGRESVSITNDTSSQATSNGANDCRDDTASPKVPIRKCKMRIPDSGYSLMNPIVVCKRLKVFDCNEYLSTDDEPSDQKDSDSKLEPIDWELDLSKPHNPLPDCDDDRPIHVRIKSEVPDNRQSMTRARTMFFC